MEKKRVMFVTGTRADYGKMKPLMKALTGRDDFETVVFVCGMHLSKTFGSTYKEVLKDRYDEVHVAFGLRQTGNMSADLGATVTYLSGYIEHVEPDMIVVHGDRMDALAGAIVGALHNVVVAHIEGGELSGTIDESTRHAISKFSHVHFVCTEEARTRLKQLGEEENRIYVIGSPDIDVMLSENLPTLDAALSRYEIPFQDYGLLMYHPVTTEYDETEAHAEAIVSAVLESGMNFVAIYPNSDTGSELILNAYRRFEGNKRIRLFPSLRFEYFLTLLKNARVLLGNSSAGVREAGIYGVPAIDVGTRQSGRYTLVPGGNLQHAGDDKDEILAALRNLGGRRAPDFSFGDGKSTERFLSVVTDPAFWEVGIQKHFVDLNL